ncbi:3995_t:CDS:2 [Ambispora gerdemannii]|uniref:3995_t:CDS:1 n=1 Tax=Ambispora gerdemannii TaxID=144530 RepID=A0A9N9CF79_9GLOM|nr:3995_t:CDS:2 [Ambispora gerdemannii]
MNNYYPDYTRPDGPRNEWCPPRTRFLPILEEIEFIKKTRNIDKIELGITNIDLLEPFDYDHPENNYINYCQHNNALNLQHHNSDINHRQTQDSSINHRPNQGCDINRHLTKGCYINRYPNQGDDNNRHQNQAEAEAKKERTRYLEMHRQQIRLENLIKKRLLSPRLPTLTRKKRRM